jgi:hypothetical protein
LPLIHNQCLCTEAVALLEGAPWDLIIRLNTGASSQILCHDAAMHWQGYLQSWYHDNRMVASIGRITSDVISLKCIIVTSEMCAVPKSAQGPTTTVQSFYCRAACPSCHHCIPSWFSIIDGETDVAQSVFIPVTLLEPTEHCT